jgi:hypothetical protein
MGQGAAAALKEELKGVADAAGTVSAKDARAAILSQVSSHCFHLPIEPRPCL